MLTHEELGRLTRTLRDRKILSIYLDVGARDPAHKHAWRTQLDDSIRRIRDGTASPPDKERAAFDKAVALLDGQLSSAAGARSWVGFACGKEVHHSESLPVRTPAVVAWDIGPRIAPYLAAIRQCRPVILAEVNAEGARLYRYDAGILEKLEHLRAHVTIEPQHHMGSMPRRGFHTGTRGSTGTDAAQRELREGTRRMLRELSQRLTILAGADGWIIIGGTPLPAKAARAALPKSLTSRSMIVPEMHIWASDAQIRECAESGAAALQDAQDLAAVSSAVREAGAGRGRGVLGPEGTIRALESGAVEKLYLSEKFIEMSPETSDSAVRSALEHGALPEVVHGAAASRLDHFAEGMAARLRYPARTTA
ncbi:MAG TPA: hypothetical protein VFN39_11770 [Gemmatimonadaceae bacterium]|nr:hypothetical protein [Gemmatimonadaceae bacterium]